MLRIIVHTHNGGRFVVLADEGSLSLRTHVSVMGKTGLGENINIRDGILRSLPRMGGTLKVYDLDAHKMGLVSGNIKHMDIQNL